jgi:hypothetical protein
MNYGELKSQFQGLLNRRDITPSQITTFVDQAISRCQRQIRIPPMEKVTTVTIDSSLASGIPIPADFLELISLQASDGVELTHSNLELVKTSALNSGTGMPRIWTRQGSKWLLAPSPDTGDVITITYYAEFSALVNDADTNDLTELASDLPIYAALSYACDWFQDDRAAVFEGRYQAIKQELADQKNLDELSGNAVVGPAFAYPCDD